MTSLYSHDIFFFLVDFQTGLWEKYLVTGDWSQSRSCLALWAPRWEDIWLLRFSLVCELWAVRRSLFTLPLGIMILWLWHRLSIFFFFIILYLKDYSAKHASLHTVTYVNVCNTLHICDVTISVGFMNTVLYVSTQPSNMILLMLGDDNFTILKRLIYFWRNNTVKNMNLSLSLSVCLSVCLSVSLSLSLSLSVSLSLSMTRTPTALINRGWFELIFEPLENKFIDILGNFLVLSWNVCCVYPIELPRWGNSKACTQHTIILFKIEKSSRSLSPLSSWPGVMINPLVSRITHV